MSFDENTVLQFYNKLPDDSTSSFSELITDFVVENISLFYKGEIIDFISKKLDSTTNEIDNFFDKDFFELLKPIKENIKLLYKLRDHYEYKLYVLSNYHKDSFEYVFEHNNFFKLFEGCLISCYFKLLKPEEKIYDTLLYEFGLIPEETLFIDDIKGNIEAAEKKHIKGLHLTDYTKLKKELEKILEI